MALNRLLKDLSLAGLLVAFGVSTANAESISVFTTDPNVDSRDRGSFFASAFVNSPFGPGAGNWKSPDGVFTVRSFGDGGFGGGTPSTAEVSRMYHIFDIPSLDPGKTITSAVLKIPHGSRSYASTVPGGAGDPTETVAFFDVSTAPEVLRNPDTSQADAVLDAIFDDLGTGASYGGFVASASSNNTTESIVLTPDAVAALNAALGGTWAIGGKITSNTQTAFGAEEQVFKGSEDGRDNPPNGYPFFAQSELELTVVPVPPAVLLFASAIAGLGVIRRRRAKQI
ncbi:MAG: VPLPA-CTERM sorting domain-containing protein [Pseudomonadota bacterium]